MSHRFRETASQQDRPRQAPIDSEPGSSDGSGAGRDVRSGDAGQPTSFGEDLYYRLGGWWLDDGRPAGLASVEEAAARDIHSGTLVEPAG